MRWGRGSGALARLTFTDRCNEITCFARHVHSEREREERRERGEGEREGDERGCSVQFARIRPRTQPPVKCCRVGAAEC